jgi:hypothetical protein
MTAHPTRPQSEHDRNRAELSAHLRAPQLRPLRGVDRTAPVRSEASTRTMEGPEYAF